MDKPREGLRFWNSAVLPYCLELVSEWTGEIYDCNAHVGKYPYMDMGYLNTWQLDQGFGFIEDYAVTLNLRGVVISSFEALCYDHHDGNRRLAELLAKTSIPIKGYISVHPLQKDSIDILAAYKDNHSILGVKFHPLIQHIDPSSPVMVQLCKIIGQYGLVVVIHTGSHHQFTMPDRMYRLVDKCPETTFVLAHMGGTRTHLAVELAESHKNVFLETSLASSAMRRIEEAVSRVGAERILFGTDYPCSNPFVELVKLLTADISRVEKQSILYRNAERLFHRDRTS